MDVDNNKNTVKINDINQNGFLKQNHSESIEGVNGISDSNMSGANPDSTLETIGESNVEVLAGVNLETKDSNEPKAKKIVVKGKGEKPSNIKNSTRGSIKKINNTTEIKGNSNGTVVANMRLKQSVVKNKSFNDRHVTNVDLNKGMKLTVSTSIIHKDKLSKSELTSSDGNSVHSEANSSGKSHRLGKLPAYDFSFRCHERAEKRKEFYTKLEQRIHAQEIEKTNQQAKSKENQDAEIKLLRKSLTFKATPMPSFSPPPKADLKKIPITRPKSPKLGRNKNSSSMEGDGERTPRQARLSLDEKMVPHNKASQGLGSTTQSKQPVRKSLPRLPSEKTCLAKTAPNPPIKEDTSESVPNEVQHVTENGSLVA